MADVLRAEIVIVGAGLAGARMCQLLRAAGCAARVVLVGEEPSLPYDRPPLTSAPGRDTDLAATMQIDVTELADEVVLGRTATRLRESAAGWRVELDDLAEPTAVEAGTVVVATGAAPIAAPWPVETLHTRHQADHLWARIRAGARLAVIGGGWIGCEVAWAAVDRGAGVHLVEAAEQLLPGRVPAEVAARVARSLAEHGVTVTLGARVTAVTPTPGGVLVGAEAAGATMAVEADVALAALGVRPATGWLPGSVARSAAGALLTDPWGRTEQPGLFAVGDAAARWSPRAGRHLPGGHWTAAFNGPAAVAPTVADWVAGDRGRSRWADPQAAPAEDTIPYTFSDLGPHTLLLLGDPAEGSDTRVVWRDEGATWSAWTLAGGDPPRLRGVCAWDRPRDVVAARRALRAAPDGHPLVDPGALADPAVPATRCFPAPAE